MGVLWDPLPAKILFVGVLWIQMATNDHLTVAGRSGMLGNMGSSLEIYKPLEGSLWPAAGLENEIRLNKRNIRICYFSAFSMIGESLFRNTLSIATSAAVQPSSSSSLGLARSASRVATTSGRPQCTAVCRGRRPPSGRTAPLSNALNWTPVTARITRIILELPELPESAG